MIITKTINVDLWIRQQLKEIPAVQGETAVRKLVVKLFANREPWIIGEDISFGMRYRKPDGTGGSYDTLPDGALAWEAEGNAVSFLLAPQMLTVPGRVEAQLVLLQGEEILATFPLCLLVERNVAADLVESRNYTNWAHQTERALREMLREAKESGLFDGPAGPTPVLQAGSVATLPAGSAATAVITGSPEHPVLELGIPRGMDAQTEGSLSISGQAADAAAVGTALAGKAPEGFGLGGLCVSVNSWDDATANGFYMSDGWFGYVSNQGRNTVQECFGQFSGFIYKRMRHFTDNVWSDWEWVNPRLIPGTEYRTTERWNGNPVYAIAVNFESLPNASEKRKYQICSGVDQIVSVSMQMIHSSGSKFAGVLPGLASYWAGQSGNGEMYAAVETTKDLSEYTAYFLIKYTKV